MSVVTISRQFGAGGKTLGEILAQRMSYTFINAEFIQLIATKVKVSTDWVESIEKEAGGKFLKFISGLVPKSFVERILDDTRGYIDEEVYVEALHEIIIELAKEGNTVILGRGGQYILRDYPDAYHILLVADKPDRIEFLKARYDLSEKQAIQTIASEDKRRMNLYRKFGREDYDKPGLYHLVLNMSKLKMEQAADLVGALVPKTEILPSP